MLVFVLSLRQCYNIISGKETPNKPTSSWSRMKNDDSTTDLSLNHPNEDDIIFDNVSIGNDSDNMDRYVYAYQFFLLNIFQLNLYFFVSIIEFQMFLL